MRVDGRDLRDARAALLPPPARRRPAGPVPLQRARSPTTSASRAPTRPTRRSRTSRRRSASTASRAGFERRARRTTVREGGAGLSAGERQLISIARALLADPRILILDEATSNIDRPTEILIEAGARPAAARPDVDHHRPPPRDRPPRRRDPRDRARPDQPARTLRRPARDRGAVQAPRTRATRKRRRSAAGGRAALGAGHRQPREKLRERRKLYVGVASGEELVDPAQVRDRGARSFAAPASVSFA